MQKRKWRPVHGVVLLDKPLGLSSNQALQQVRRLFQAEKAGHTGALDPLATGMLPLCFGEATKYSQFLLDADKYYRTSLHLGVRTTTGDKEGEVLTEMTPPGLSGSQLESVLDRFRGSIEQIPPMYSALKHEGKPLYEYARKGIVIERKKRAVQIHQLNLLERTKDSMTLDVRCSKGTYIRSIGEDIGEALGCGAHLSSLRRISTAHYEPKYMLTLEELTEIAKDGYDALDQHLLPIDTAVMHLNKVELRPDQATDLCHGRRIEMHLHLDLELGSLIRLYRKDSEEFLGLGMTMDGIIKPHRLVNTQQA